MIDKIGLAFLLMLIAAILLATLSSSVQLLGIAMFFAALAQAVIMRFDSKNPRKRKLANIFLLALGISIIGMVLEVGNEETVFGDTRTDTMAGTSILISGIVYLIIALTSAAFHAFYPIKSVIPSPV